MDPTNTTPIQPDQAGAASARPGAPVQPGASTQPSAPVQSGAMPEMPVNEPTPVTPAVSPIPSPASPVAVSDPAVNTANTVGATPVMTAPASPAIPPVNADVANAALNPPVNPVVAPGSNPGAAPAAAGTMSMNQMFQSQSGANTGVLDETTAIAVPEGPKPPDPVEEELKAPLKAAAPVPGSIGSAVSMPPSGNAAPQNVAFNDPVAEANNPMTAGAKAPAGKKASIFDKLMAKTKMNKNTLILLTVVAGLIVVVLIGVLVMVATGAI